MAHNGTLMANDWSGWVAGLRLCSFFILHLALFILLGSACYILNHLFILLPVVTRSKVVSELRVGNEGDQLRMAVLDGSMQSQL